MAVQACPTGEVAAPAAAVWWFLSHPKHLDAWWNACVERADPDGPLASGQQLQGSSRAFMHTFRLSWDVEEVDAARGLLRMTVHLPAGLVNHVTVKVSPVDARTSRLSFG